VAFEIELGLQGTRGSRDTLVTDVVENLAERAITLELLV
jgi:hypothetical protein